MASSDSAMASDPVVVVGAGLVGGAVAAMLAQRGYKVELYEKRPDQRIAEKADAARLSHLGQSTDVLKRSINLALSHRGRSALKALGLEDKVLAECVRMPSRAIHPPNSTEIVEQPYGVGDQAIWSASRSLLNRVVMEACEKSPNVKIFFDHGLKSVDADGNAVFEHTATKTTRSVKGSIVIGCDGAYSAVRNSMLRIARVNFSREFINHGYKELNVPPVKDATTGKDTFALRVPNALHIWPRSSFMMIALPNPDFTFTCTLFAPWETLDKLDSDPTAVRPFFVKHFSDVLPLIPELEHQFSRNPSSALVMTHTSPWNVNDKICLLGDAAHAIVPFYGQGANAGFEDSLVFCECLDAIAAEEAAKPAGSSSKLSGDALLSAAVRKYAVLRKPEGDAIAKLSLDNYVEMRHKTASPVFLLRKKFEGLLHAIMPELWIPQYTMVAFTRIPYSEVIRRAERQEKILDWTFGAAAAGIAGGLVYAAVKHGLFTKAKDAVVAALRK